MVLSQYRYGNGTDFFTFRETKTFRKIKVFRENFSFLRKIFVVEARKTLFSKKKL
jgi:hypothetical protein